MRWTMQGCKVVTKAFAEQSQARRLSPSCFAFLAFS